MAFEGISDLAQKAGSMAEDLGKGAAELGEQISSTGDPEAMRTMAVDYANQALGVVNQHLQGLSGVGAVGQAIAEAQKSFRAIPVNQRVGMKPSAEEERMPKGPGFAYVNHLFNRARGRVQKQIQEQEKKKSEDGLNIYVDQMEALKMAIKVMGIYSDKNPGGMPIEMKAAKKIWFGDTQIPEHEEAEWRSLVEMGDPAIDSKKVRKFVNYDGSMTWEMLNEDKTVMSRFTMGEFKGIKIFTQGGYNKFAEALEKVKAKSGPDREGEFESIRGMFAGG